MEQGFLCWAGGCTWQLFVLTPPFPSEAVLWPPQHPLHDLWGQQAQLNETTWGHAPGSLVHPLPLG